MTEIDTCKFCKAVVLPGDVVYRVSPKYVLCAACHRAWPGLVPMIEVVP